MSVSNFPAIQIVNRKLLNGKFRKHFTTHEKPKAVCAYEKPSGAPDLD